MAGYSHTEDVLNGLQSFIQDNFETYIDEILSDKSNDYPLPVPTDNDVIIGILDPEAYDNYPVVFLVPMEDAYDVLSMGSDNLEVTASVWLIIAGYESTTMTKMIMRYGAAFRNMFRANFSLSNAVDEISTDTIHYFPEWGADDKIQAVRVTVKIIKEIVN